MRKKRLAIIGFGRLGQACARAIMADERVALAGIVRRPESLGNALPDPFGKVAVVSHISELADVDAALLCIPTEQVTGIARELLQQRIPVVECATVHGDAFIEHKEELARYAVHFRVPVLVGAGWDPGLLSLFRSLFALFCPHGHTELTRRPGINLHHSTIAGATAGVRAALATEQRDAAGRRQNYIYVQLEPGAVLAEVEQALRRDPLFAEEEVLLFAVENIAELEEEGHGVLLERRGSAGGAEHQLFLLEARFSEEALCAQVMLTAACALEGVGRHACTLADLPINTLWGEMSAMAEREWQ